MRAPFRRAVFAALLVFGLASCVQEHEALGPTERLTDKNLPTGMFGPLESKDMAANTMVTWLLVDDIENTKHNPPEMLRGLAYLEFINNQLLENGGVSVHTKKPIKLVVMILRDALGLPLDIRPSEAINMYWSTASFLEISNFEKVEFNEEEQELQDAVSAVKSPILTAVLNAKLNLWTERNAALLASGGTPEFGKTTVPSAGERKSFKRISTRTESREYPPMSATISEELQADLKKAVEAFSEQAEIFAGVGDSYEKDLYETTKRVFEQITAGKEAGWETVVHLQSLLDFTTVASIKLKPSLSVVPKSEREMTQALRKLTTADIGYVKSFLGNFKAGKLERLVAVQRQFAVRQPRIIPAANHIDKHEIGLQEMINQTAAIPVDRIDVLSGLLSQSSESVSKVAGELGAVTRAIDDATGELADLTAELSFAAGQYLAALGADLQTVAVTVAEAIQSGISADLDALAQGFGFDSFADAVAAYNEAYGTSYTVDQAKEALGID